MTTPTNPSHRRCPACGRPCNLLLRVVEDGRLLCVTCYGVLLRQQHQTAVTEAST